MNLENNIRKIISEELKPKMILKEMVEISDNLKYHLDNEISLTENIFRVYSDSFFDLINEVRSLYEFGLIDLNKDDKWIIESDLGKTITLDNGNIVYLDAPFEVEETLTEIKHHGKNVKLNSPFRTPGGPKKFAVYVKTPGGVVKKVTFGDPNLRIKNSSKARAKSFRARHKCDQKKDRTTAGYWSCNVSRYRKKLGLKSSRSW
jgi:hypothetical protein